MLYSVPNIQINLTEIVVLFVSAEIINIPLREGVVKENESDSGSYIKYWLWIKRFLFTRSMTGQLSNSSSFVNPLQYKYICFTSPSHDIFLMQSFKIICARVLFLLYNVKFYNKTSIFSVTSIIQTFQMSASPNDLVGIQRLLYSECDLLLETRFQTTTWNSP